MEKLKTLTPDVRKIVEDKGTEWPNTGEYNSLQAKGSYLCRRCGLALFRSDQKFLSSCGWPSFDDSILQTVSEQPDPDGSRTEINCRRCKAHLGHIFKGEHATAKNTRYCVNSLAIDFVNDTNVIDSEEIIVAGGCFWGVEYYFAKLSGVLKTEVGYTGGHTLNPTYHDVCQGNTGHYEAVRILYDPQVINFETVCKYFYEIHDPTQANGQGPDIGQQYQSAIFFLMESQKIIAEKLKTQLQQNGYNVVTKILPATVFWPAEEYHQLYYEKKQGDPYCHVYVKRF